MEVLVTDSIGLPSDAVVSVRFGTTRRQAPLDTVSSHPLKFPSSLDSICEPLKIDILQPIATTRLVLFPHAEQYQIGFEQSEDMELGLNIKPSTAADRQDASSRPGSAMPVKFQDAAASAKDYLEGHGLLRYVQSMLHAVIQVKPKDPYAFMIEQLSSAQSKSKTVRSRPSSAIPGGRSLSRPTSAAPAGRVPVPPSSPSPSAMGEKARPPVGGGRLSNEDGSQVFHDRPLEQPASPQRETLKSHEVPELSNDEPQVSSDQPLQKAAPPREDTLKPHEVPEPQNEGDARVLCEQPLDKPAPPQLETLRPRVPEPTEPPPPLPPPVESERPVLLPSPTSPQLEATASPRAVSTATAATLEAMEQPATDVENLRLRMRGLLEHAYGSGKLSQAVDAALASGPKSQPDDGLDELKLKMRTLMEDAANSGRLEEAIKNTVSKDASVGDKPTKAPEPAQADGELEVIKAKLRDLCTTATESGELEEVIDRIANQRTVEDMQTLKGKILGVLESATESGKLAQALEAVSPKSASAAPKADLELNEAKAKMRSLMQEATESGRLAEALQETADKKAGRPSLAQDELGEVRTSLRTLLGDSTKNGELEQALHKVEAEQDIDGVLLQAPESGSLDIVSKSVPNELMMDKTGEKNQHRTGGELDVEQIKSKMKSLLQESPRRTNASPLPDDVAKPAFTDDLDRLKSRLRDILAEACVSGRLGEVVSSVTTPKRVESEGGPKLVVADQPMPAEEAANNLAAAKAKEFVSGDSPAAEVASSAVVVEVGTQEATAKLVEKLAAPKPPVTKAEAMAAQAKVEQEQVKPQPKASPEVAADNAIHGQPDAAQLNETKAKLRCLMREASESGKLSRALATITQKQASFDNVKDEVACEAGLDDIKAKLRQLIQEAQESGKLTQSLETIIATSDQAAAAAAAATAAAAKTQAEEREGQGELNDMKAKLRGLLQEASESGKLAEALGQMASSKEEFHVSAVSGPPREEELEAIKAKLRGLMQEATESGKLCVSCDSIADRKQDETLPAAGPDDREMAKIKAKLRVLMTEATESGQFAQTLANISDTTADVVAPAADAAPQLHVDELKDTLNVQKQECQILHSTVDRMAMEMEALRRTNQELSRQLAEAGRSA